MTTERLARRERLALCDTLDLVGPDAPTLCDPWRTPQLAAHLVLRERRPDLSAGVVVPFLAERTERATQEYAAGRPYPRLVDEVRSGPPVWHPTYLGVVDDVVNLVEMVVHHEDVLRGDGAKGARREVDGRLNAALWSALRALGPLGMRRSPVGVVLLTPGHEPLTAKGGTPAVRVSGDAVELLLTAYGRLRVADVELEGSPKDVAAFRAARLGPV